MVGLADRAKHVAEVGAKLRMVSQYLLVPEGLRHHNMNSVRVSLLARKLLLRHERTFAEQPEVSCSVRKEKRRLSADSPFSKWAQGKAKGKRAETWTKAPHRRAVS
jgi:hypothetical protein